MVLVQIISIPREFRFFGAVKWYLELRVGKLHDRKEDVKRAIARIVDGFYDDLNAVLTEPFSPVVKTVIICVPAGNRSVPTAAYVVLTMQQPIFG
jgi:hypothetical protein